MTIHGDKNQRKQEVLRFVENNPFCSIYEIFTKGKIHNSKMTIQVIEELVSGKKIRVLHTENGKPRYFLTSRKVDLLTVKHLFKELIYKWKQATRSFTHTKSLVEKYAVLFENRIKILEHEYKHDENLNLKDTIELFVKIDSFLDNPKDVQGHIKHIDWQIKRDKYYLKHELHSNPRNIHYSFQERKRRHERRSLAALLDMKKKGRHEYSLRTVDYNTNIDKLDSDSDFEYEEIFNRLYAEHNRTLYHNPEMTPNRVMLLVTNARLHKINKNPSLSENYEYEKRTLEDWKCLISKIPIEELLNSPKYEGGYVPRGFLSRYSMKEKSKND